MDLSWAKIELDLLLDAGYDGSAVVREVLRVPNVRATDFRQAGLRVRDEHSGEIAGALGAEFLPDQSGQLLVLVLVSEDPSEPAATAPEAGLSRPLAEAVLQAAVEEEAAPQLGAGVLRFDRALLGGGATADLFGWLARSVVRLLAADVESWSEEEVAALLAVPRDAPAAGPTGSQPDSAEPAWLRSFDDEQETREPDAAVADNGPVGAPGALASDEGLPEEDSAALPGWLDDEAEPPADAEQAEMLRLLMESLGEVDGAATPASLPRAAPPAGRPPREELEAFARREIGDEAAEMLSEENLALLMAALQGFDEHPPGEDAGNAELFDEQPPAAQPQGTLDELADDEEWWAALAPVFEGEGRPPGETLPEAGTAAQEPEPQPRAGHAEPAMTAGPLPLRDIARRAAREDELHDDAESERVPQSGRYEYPPRGRSQLLAGERTSYYLCAACGRYSAVRTGPGSYRCYRCQAVIEYQVDEPEDGPGEVEDA